MYAIELMQSAVQSFGLTSEIWTAQLESSSGSRQVLSYLFLLLIFCFQLCHATIMEGHLA
jgi:hypothetical protein